MAPEKMSISVNGESRVPPGFRFHPTEQELLQYYLRKKVGSQMIDLDVICEVDLNKLEPWDIQETCKIGSTPQNEWYFFSHKDKKYPTGTRTNRATTAGFWKATGRDKSIYSTTGRLRIGMRKTLVFYKGRAPHGQKSDWIMHEYRLVDGNINKNNNDQDLVRDSTTNDSHHEIKGQHHCCLGTDIEEGWVVCKIFKKKFHHKAAIDCPNKHIPSSNHHDSTDTTQLINRYSQVLQFQNSCSSDGCDDLDADEGALEQIFRHIQEPLKDETTIDHQSVINKNVNTSKKLPSLVESTNSACTQPHFYDHHHDDDDNPSRMRSCSFPAELPAADKTTEVVSSFSAQQMMDYDYDDILGFHNFEDASPKTTITNSAAATCTRSTTSNATAGFISDWADLDRLVASHLNGAAISVCQLPDHEQGSSHYHYDLHQLIKLSSFDHVSSTSRVNFDGPLAGGPDYSNEVDLWSFTRSIFSNDSLCNVSDASL